MEFLTNSGIGIEIKKGWLKVNEGPYNITSDSIQLVDTVAGIRTVNPKENIEVIFPHVLTLNGRYMVAFSYHPTLLARGWISGPTLLTDNLIHPKFKYKAEKATDFSELPWIISLNVFKL